MKEVNVLREINSLLRIFAECGNSVCKDIKNLDCTSPQKVSSHLLPSLLFKIKKLKECFVVIHKICKSVKKEDIKCLPCCKSSKRSQFKINLPIDQTMLSFDKNTALFHIDSIKRSNCQILSKILNNYWSPAGFDQRCLNNQIIHNLIIKVKANALTIQKICQSQPQYTPWTLVMSRKRKNFESAESEEKRRKKSSCNKF